MNCLLMNEKKFISIERKWVIAFAMFSFFSFIQLIIKKHALIYFIHGSNSLRRGSECSEINDALPPWINCISILMKNGMELTPEWSDSLKWMQPLRWMNGINWMMYSAGKEKTSEAGASKKTIQMQWVKAIAAAITHSH